MVSAAAWPREVSRRRATDEGVAVGGAVAEDAAARGAGSTAAGNIVNDIPINLNYLYFFHF